MLQTRGSRAGSTTRETSNGVEFFPGFPRCAQDLQVITASGLSTMLGDNPIRAAGVGSAGVKPARVRFVSQAPAAAGETMQVTVELLKAGAVVAVPLTVLFTFGPSVAPGVIDLEVDPALSLQAGDLLLVARNYVPGGGPTMGATGVFVDYAGDTQPI